MAHKTIKLLREELDASIDSLTYCGLRAWHFIEATLRMHSNVFRALNYTILPETERVQVIEDSTAGN